MSISRRKLLIDCDTGVDDCYALMMAIAKNDIVDVVAITCVNGNVDIDKVCMNTLRTVKVMNSIDKIPVYRGCQDPLVVLPTRTNSSFYHGQDGLGDVPHIEPKPSEELYSKLQTEPASLAISRLSKEHENALELVCLGPLTNLAITLRLDPDLPKRINKLHILGGTSRGRGNITTAAEFNFYIDPEAAHIVISSFSPHCEIWLTTYETTLDCDIEWAWFDEFLTCGNERRRKFLKGISSHTHNFSRKNSLSFGKGCVVCDAYTVCCALDPDAITNSSEVFVGIELGGILSRGAMVVDRIEKMESHILGKVKLIEAVDHEMLKNMLNGVLQ